MSYIKSRLMMELSQHTLPQVDGRKVYKIIHGTSMIELLLNMSSLDFTTALECK